MRGTGYSPWQSKIEAKLHENPSFGELLKPLPNQSRLNQSKTPIGDESPSPSPKTVRSSPTAFLYCSLIELSVATSRSLSPSSMARTGTSSPATLPTKSLVPYTSNVFSSIDQLGDKQIQDIEAVERKVLFNCALFNSLNLWGWSGNGKGGRFAEDAILEGRDFGRSEALFSKTLCAASFSDPRYSLGRLPCTQKCYYKFQGYGDQSRLKNMGKSKRVQARKVLEQFWRGRKRDRRY
ncbi:hypothetical protein CK203_036943 [Vitis vinifera]|uniref:Uncharacterized protein n=1 Tax=Vitis vinifera TaxID=29760 RepID=A0A438IUT0_VITVI|nr:hypothetical protein CK203_036943 [Vitis vinifera]